MDLNQILWNDRPIGKGTIDYILGLTRIWTWIWDGFFSISSTRRDWALLDIKQNYSDSCGWVWMKLGRPPDKKHMIRFWDCSGSRIIFFHFSITGVWGSQYRPKELRMNIYDMFGGADLQITNGIGGGLNFIWVLSSLLFFFHSYKRFTFLFCCISRVYK